MTQYAAYLLCNVDRYTYMFTLQLAGQPIDEPTDALYLQYLPFLHTLSFAFPFTENVYAVAKEERTYMQKTDSTFFLFSPPAQIRGS